MFLSHIGPNVPLTFQIVFLLSNDQIILYCMCSFKESNFFFFFFYLLLFKKNLITKFEFFIMFLNCIGLNAPLTSHSNDKFCFQMIDSYSEVSVH